jgi:hypothetical protein
MSACRGRGVSRYQQFFKFCFQVCFRVLIYQESLQSSNKDGTLNTRRDITTKKQSLVKLTPVQVEITTLLLLPNNYSTNYVDFTDLDQ